MRSERGQEHGQGLPHRDVGVFDQRADGYDAGWLGRLHHEIADRALNLAAAIEPSPRWLLDVGCGTGYLLRRLAERLPDAKVLAGVDPAERMIGAARQTTTDPRLAFTVARAEQLPYEDDSFDLVLSTTSFDHWHDQPAGLRECARVLRPGGHLLLSDLFSVWLVPTLLGGRRAKARTKRRASGLMIAAGFSQPRWHGRYLAILNTADTTKPLPA